MESMSEPDPFGTQLEGRSWEGHPLHSSISHYYLAIAAGQALGEGEASVMAALWVLLTPKAKILELEGVYRRNRDAFFAAFWGWMDRECPKPGSASMLAAKAAVAGVFRDVEGAADQPEAGDGAAGAPGK